MMALEILKAMQFLEEELILEAENSALKKQHAQFHRPALIAAILLMGILLITACTAMGGAAWFLQYFSHTAQENLSAQQMEYIVANTIDVNKSQNVNGYTLTLKSTFSDGRNSLLHFDLTAPAGTVLNADTYASAYATVMENETGRDLGASINWELWDEDRTDNKVSIACPIEIFTDEDISGEFVGHTCRLYIYGLKQVSWLEPKELGVREEKLAEGCWTFDIHFP